MLSLIFLTLVTAEEAPSPKKETYRMEITGDSKFNFSGVCVSTDEPRETRISGTVPGEVQIDAKIQKCSLKGEEPGKTLNVRLFQNRKLLLKRDDLPATAGVEIVIPLPLSKKH